MEELEATKATLKEAMRRVKAYKAKGLALQETAKAHEARLREEAATVERMQVSIRYHIILASWRRWAVQRGW